MDAGRRLFVSALQMVRERQGEETQCLAQLSVRIAVYPVGLTRAHWMLVPGSPSERRERPLGMNDECLSSLATMFQAAESLHLFVIRVEFIWLLAGVCKTCLF